MYLYKNLQIIIHDIIIYIIYSLLLNKFIIKYYYKNFHNLNISIFSIK